MAAAGRIDAHLCDCCEDAFKSILHPRERYDPHDGSCIGDEFINVGWLDSIMKYAQCSLCRLIARIWETVRIADVDCSRRRYVMIDDSSARPLTATGQRRGWTMIVRFFYPGSNGQPSVPVPTIYEPRFSLAAESHALLPAESSATEALLFGRIRLRERPYDQVFLQNCVESCIRDHGTTCRHPVRRSLDRAFPLTASKPLPETLYVVDVDEHRITALPSGADYAILSYVWGDTNCLRLTKANYDQLTITGGLRNVQKPQTIAHAMEITAVVRMRYIWIDSLCIIQDSDEHKLRLLSRMDDIYTSAALTIIAAGGTEANAGLWHKTGTAHSQQIVEEIGGLSFVALEPPLSHVLEQSVYNSRAWTWQEYVLSKRLLVFSMSQVYFSCEQSAYAEDYVHMISSDGQQQVQRVPQDTELEIIADQVDNFPVYWRTLIREYTKRVMTFEADGLNAVKGVMASYCRSIGETPICGLPLSTLFEYGLLWFPTVPLRRRAAASVGMFPSWSWLGWIGNVDYEDTDDAKDIKEGRIIHKWSHMSRLNSPDHKKPVRACVCSDYGYVSFDIETQQSADTSDISLLETGVLHFSTLSVWFPVAKTVITQFVMSDDHHCRHTGIHAIMSGDKQVGGIHLEHIVAEKLLSSDDCERHEFIALSEPTRSWYLPERRTQSELDEDGDWVPLFDTCLIDGENKSDAVYNVMLITWEGDLAYRAGIGQIHKESFHAAGPCMKDIQLG